MISQKTKKVYRFADHMNNIEKKRALMKIEEKDLTLLKPSIIIIIQTISLFSIFYILSNKQLNTNIDQIKLSLLTLTILLGSYLTFKSLAMLKKLF